MVLSNKKLKQKLRAELLSKRVSESEPESAKKNPDSNSDPRSLKSLLDSVTQKPRLSKREIRRKNIPFSNGSIVETEEKVEEIVKKKRTKRKREEESETTSDNKESNKNKKKKKKNTKSKKNKKQKIVSEEEQVVLQVENVTERQVNEDVATKVYVGGIPYSYTEEDIRYYFESVGTITDVDCMKFPDTGKFRGIAIISFETEAAAKEALALDRAEMGGMQLTIQPYKSTRATNKPTGFAPKMVEGYNRIYVGNLSWDITEDDLKKFFSDCNVSSIRLGTNKETGEFRGYAHVDFSDSVSVAMALKLDQEIVCGRPVKISCAVPKGAAKTQPRSDPTSNEVRRSVERASSKEVAVNVEAPTDNEVGNIDLSVSGKLRRRTCYVCGEKGHLSSSCPKAAVNVEAPTVNEVDYYGSTGNEVDYYGSTGNEVDNTGLSVSSGKLRRRTCYVCGEKGHLSSACPKAPVNVEAPMVNEVDYNGSTGNEVDNTGLSVSSGKLRRRTCYVCGEKGHLSSACPKAPVNVEAPTVNEVDYNGSTGNEVDNTGLSISSGKLRRRTCYVCGEKGHMSSACPKGQVVVEAPTVMEVDNGGLTGNEAPTVNEVDNNASTVSSGKLRRRTCYECGEKGHLSSACPNKKSAETTN